MVIEKNTLNSIQVILDKGFKPSNVSRKFLDVLGKENISAGLKNGLLKIVCNADKTFDVTMTDVLHTDLENVLRRKLRERGYQLTLKGEKYVKESYSQNNIDSAIHSINVDEIALDGGLL
tara:strand:- start:172 stop:531 length:360 start_codon:yes stop_codon:yes gene_type:complete